MASTKGKTLKRRVRYFFIKVDGQPHLHRVLHINRPQDLVLAWDFIDHKRKQYVWSDVRKTMQNAFTCREAGQILNRTRMSVLEYIYENKIKTPQMAYSLSTRNPSAYLLSEDDVLDLHQAMSEQHIGRPRKDGQVTNRSLPTRAEVKTLVQGGDVLYTKDDKGNFIPIWKEQVW